MDILRLLNTTNITDTTDTTDNMDTTDTINTLPHIEKLNPYVPGKPIETLAREKNLTNIIKLASNENPYGPSPKVNQAIIQNLNSLNRYPDPDQHILKNALADFYNIDSNMLTIGNGSDELLQMIMRVFVSPDNNIIFPQYSFISYKINAEVINSHYKETKVLSNWQNDLNDILKNIDQNTKLICLANPNNPTGTYLDYTQISAFLNKVPSNIIVLLDEAYFEYVQYSNTTQAIYKQTQDPSIELLKNYKNLIITRTFSKAYGLAGLRVGYAITSPEITAAINKIKQPFNVNRLAQYAATAALIDQGYIKKLIDINNQQREYLYQEFDKLNILYIPSFTNFITIHTTNHTNSVDLYEYLLCQGIIIRPIANYGLMNNLRISIGLPEENKALVNSLNSYNKNI